MSKKNPYYDEEGTGETPLVDEFTIPAAPVTPKDVQTPEPKVVEQVPTVPVVTPAPVAPEVPIVAVPTPPTIPLAVPMPSPKVMPIPIKEAVPKNPSRPNIPVQDIKEELKQEKEIYVPPVVPQGFKEVVEFTPARQRAERTKFNFTPEPLALEDNDDRASIPDAPGEEEKAKSLFKVKKINPYAGGRWQILAIRYTVWTVLALIALGGVKTLFLPTKANIPALAQAIGAQLNINGFPIQSGQDLARSFAREYLTINPKAGDQRSINLSHFLPNGKEQGTWTSLLPESAPETILSGPMLVEAPNLADKTHAVFTFSALVKAGSADPKWVYLAVTVFADTNGLVTISGPPAFVDNPGVVTDSGAFAYPKSDSAANSLSVDLPGFFKAWAASDSTGLSLYTQSDATQTVLNGLGGNVSFVEINNLRVAAIDPKKPSSAYGKRYAEVNVTWRANGNIWVQGYRLTVLQTVDGKWYVQDIFGGGFGATP